jgi:DNA-directed RNA polymerase subunit RPC12/RpoP
MIEFKCETCGMKYSVKDELAGKTGKCKNCGSSIKIPMPSGVGPAPTAPAQNAAPAPNPPTVVVQIQQPAATSGGIGPARKSLVVVLLLAIFTNCLQYFYLGQSGKGALFLVLDFFVWFPIIFFTCGLGLIGYIPYHLVLLVDSIVITSRLKTHAISPWRFF